jgi:diguanylate cyclase (GGDEF)-like protein
MGNAMMAAAKQRGFRIVRRPFASLTGAGRVWMLTFVLMGITAALLFSQVSLLNGLNTPVRLPWWALAVLFYLTEIYVVHIEFRRDAHSFSLSEIPLVLGLFFASPGEFVLAQMVGAAIALGLHRRQSPLKLAFNVSHFCLEATVSVIIFHRLIALGDDPLGPIGLLATFAPVAVTSLIGTVSIFLAISLSEGRLQLEKFWSVLGSGLLIAGANTSLGLLGVWIIWTRATGAWLLLIPTATVFLAYRAYTAERQERQALDFLNQSTRILQETKEIEAGLLLLLHNARDMFRGEIAEILMFSSNEGETALRTTVGPGDEETVMLPVPMTGSVDDEFAASFLQEASNDKVLASYLDARGFSDAMLAPMLGETRLIGVMVLANRLGDVSTFDNNDLKLFETLANHTGVALENGRLEKSLAQLSALEEELSHQASHDPLTGLANRVLFTDRVQHALARRGRAGSVAVLFLDLDDFKAVNDSFGHMAGDQLLRAAAERIEHCLRSEDTASRLGGDEFGILIDEVSDRSDAVYVAERIIRTLDAPYLIQGKEFFVHASVGIAFSQPGVETADALLRNADVAMYRAKNHGKGGYDIYEDGMHTAVLKRMEMKAELERAVEGDQLVLQYQPIVSLKTGRITAAEALVRWRHPRRGLLPPQEFVPLAEETGLIVPISRWVLAAACQQARLWQINSPVDQRPLIAVNLSPKHIAQPSLVDDIVEAIRNSLVQPQNLVIELTENVLMHDSESTISKLQELRVLGVQIALDDFGNGFSSLGYLRRFPLDILKVAKNFVDDLNDGAAGTELVDAMIKLGAALGVKVVAEGIESAEQYARARQLGCDAGQGFYFSQPLSAAQIEPLFRLGRPPMILDLAPKSEHATLTLPA